MRNVSEYDQRQLRLMYESLRSFENKQIELSSLVSSLEFLLNILESVDESWEEGFLSEITALEVANALEIIKKSEGEVFLIENEKREILISKSILNLKKLITDVLSDQE